MKPFIIFLVSALTVYLLMNYSAYRWIRVAFDLQERNLILLRILIWIPVLTFPLGAVLSNTYGGKAAAVLFLTGNIWLGILFYLFWINLITGIVVVSVKTFASPELLRSLTTLVQPVRIGILLGLTGLCIYGYIQSGNVVVKSLDIVVDRPGVHAPPLKIVQLSDIHLDAMKSPRWWNRIVDRTNALNPDLILLTGDIFDSPSQKLSAFEPGMKSLTARLAVLASTGNHDFYTGIKSAETYLEKAGIRLMRNQAGTIPGRVHIVAVDDPTAKRLDKTDPVPLADLTQGLSRDLPVVLMNHQPLRLKEAAEAGVDLQLSGHTHGGQIWPFNFFTGLAFPFQAGLETFGNLNLYVSTGVGWWGPPFRIGTRSEIIVINLSSRV